MKQYIYAFVNHNNSRNSTSSSGNPLLAQLQLQFTRRKSGYPKHSSSSCSDVEHEDSLFGVGQPVREDDDDANELDILADVWFLLAHVYVFLLPRSRLGVFIFATAMMWRISRVHLHLMPKHGRACQLTTNHHELPAGYRLQRMRLNVYTHGATRKDGQEQCRRQPANADIVTVAMLYTHYITHMI